MGVRTLVTLSVLLAVPACHLPSATYAHVSNEAVEYNKAVARASNDVMFLNVVRAMLHHPKHFTELTQIRGARNYSAQVGFDIPFGGGSSNEYVFKPGASASTSPTYDLAILHTDKFIRGIMQPVDPAGLRYFIDAGWPKTLILRLFIEAIEVVAANEDGSAIPGAKARLYLNSPHYGHMETYNEFQEVFAYMVPQLDIAESSAQVGPDIPVENLFSDPAKLAALLEGASHAGLRLEAEQGKPAKLKKKGRVDLVFKQDDKTAVNVGSSEFYGTLRLALPGLDPTKAANQLVRIRLRSPEGVLYHVGQVMRAEVEARRAGNPWISTYELDVTKREQVLFYAEAIEGKADVDVVSAEVGGITYVIPSSLPRYALDATTKEDGSMTVLGFLELLFDLYKSKDELPSTGAVQAVGR